ncbi:hypothetical protein AGMMS50276_31370 [Synergistales bacterium]|nr:hypothetical protein AGMMS50276_31370 [Synergistales bacterium]
MDIKKCRDSVFARLDAMSDEEVVRLLERAGFDFSNVASDSVTSEKHSLSHSYEGAKFHRFFARAFAFLRHTTGFLIRCARLIVFRMTC